MAIEILVYLSIYYFKIIIILAKYRFCYILIISLSLTISVKFLSVGLPTTVRCDESRLLIFLYLFNTIKNFNKIKF